MKIKRWLHSNAVWPPTGWVASFAVIYGLLEAALWFIERGQRRLGLLVDEPLQFTNARAILLGGAAGFYALYRIGRFHPVWNLAYSVWLRGSPWSSHRPLPLGPVHLVWQDAVVLGVLSAFAFWTARVNFLIPGLVFGLAYLLGMTFTLAFTRTWLPCLMLGFLWPALLLPPMKGPPAVGIIVALIVVIAIGHWRSLRAFPWRKDDDMNAAALRAKRAKSVLETEIHIERLSEPPAFGVRNLGWPFGKLSPKALSKPVATSTSLALCLLFGWWSYCAMVCLEIPECGPLLVLFAIVAALIRLAIYCSAVCPPFNVWGRLTSGRLIVPGFDQVFVTPLLVIIIAVLGTLASRHAGAWFREVTTATFALLWFVLLSGAPPMQKWILTGHHRYRPPTRLGANKELLRPI